MYSRPPLALLLPLVPTLAAAPALAQPFVFEQRLDPPATVGSGDRFGTPVAVDGTTAVVGNTEQVVKHQAVGAVHVFVKVGTTWVLQQTLNGTVVGARFGFAVDINGDRLAVSSVPSDTNTDGAVRVFVRSGSTWTPEAAFTAPIPDVLANDYFGSSVRIRGDRLVVGSHFYETSAQVARTGAAAAPTVVGNTVSLSWTPGPGGPPTAYLLVASPDAGRSAAGERAPHRQLRVLRRSAERHLPCAGDRHQSGGDECALERGDGRRAVSRGPSLQRGKSGSGLRRRRSVDEFAGMVHYL